MKWVPLSKKVQSEEQAHLQASTQLLHKRVAMEHDSCAHLPKSHIPQCNSSDGQRSA